MQSGVQIKERMQDTVQATNGLPPNRKAQVVIIGAGLAGLAAAQRLHEKGMKDVIVLDAQDRIGGRVHTIDYSDYVLEMGAQWLHGANENPLYKWLGEKNLLDDFEDASLSFEGLFCSNNGKEIDQRLVKKVLDIAVDNKRSLSKNCYVDIIGKNGFKNAGEVFRHQLNVIMESDKELMENKTLVNALFDWFLRYETIENCCDSMDEVSITSYTDWTDWGDGTLLNFKHGYRSLLDWFCGQMPSRQWIHLNKQVVNVEMLKSNPNGWSDDDGRQYDKPMIVKYVDVNIPAENGVTTTKNKDPYSNSNNRNHNRTGIIECNHVIATVSLGFLKKNHETFFKPPLPEVKSALIDSIGFGTVNKIVLQFDTPFWNNDHGIKLVWEKQDREDFPKWVQDIIAFDVVRKQPNLLIGWIGGRGAKLMERRSDDEIGETCMRILKTFLPSTYNRPSKLLACVCSRWNSNPFICGSYSFQSMKSFDQNVDKLHEPIYNNNYSHLSNVVANKLVSCSASRMPRVLFAGEATAGKLYSTTHGAIITGWREADRLVDHLLGGKTVNIQQVETGSNISLQLN